MARSTAKVLPVLCIGTDCVEWLGAGAERSPVYGTMRVKRHSATEIVKAATELVASLGRRPGLCLLALGHGILEQRTINLPPLQKKELRTVTLRKAANLLGAETADTLFASMALSKRSGDATEASAEHRWLVVAMRRSVVSELFLALRDAGFRFKRVVSARLAPLALARELHSSEQNACVVVGAETQAVTVSLMQGGSLVHQTVLSGRFSDSASRGTALVQELRGFGAFWRRMSRGGSLTDVYLVGFEPEQANRLRPAVHASLPGAIVAQDPAEDDGREGANRSTVLHACAIRDTFQLDLSLPLPPRRHALAATALSMTLAAGAVGLVGHAHFSGVREVWRDRSRALDEQAFELRGLGEVQASIDVAVARLETEARCVRSVGSVGLPLDQVLRDTLEAFGPRAGLLSLSTRADEGEVALELAGVTDARPASSLSALEEIAGRLEASEVIGDVRIAPPTSVPSSVSERGAVPTIPFALHAHVQRRSGEGS